MGESLLADTSGENISPIFEEASLFC